MVRKVLIALALLTVACGSDTNGDTEAARSGVGDVEIIVVDGGGEELDGARCCEEITAWAFQRFADANLPPPAVKRIIYDHAATDCPGRAGWTEPTDGGAEVHICIPEERLCVVGGGEVALFTAQGKLCVLHELSHVWLLTNMTSTTEDEFLQLNDLDAWYSLDVPWHERGVEFAAEVMAWGLMDVRLALHRLDHPACTRVVAGFELLTGVAPLVSCADQQRPG